MADEHLKQVTIATSVGDIVVGVYVEKAPLTARFFLHLVEAGFYQSGDLYRASRLGIDNGPHLIQGGAALPFLQGSRAAKKAPMLEQIETTGSSGILHRRGTLSLARDLGRTGHALAEFFICLGDFPSLDQHGRDQPDDQGFPAFGQVLTGIELLDEVAEQETAGHTHSDLLVGQMLTTPVKIERVFSVN